MCIPPFNNIFNTSVSNNTSIGVDIKNKELFRITTINELSRYSVEKYIGCITIDREINTSNISLIIEQVDYEKDTCNWG